MIKTPAFLPVFLLAACHAHRPAWGQTPLFERVLVVYNTAEPDSLAVARYYMTRRSIAEKLLCKISVTSAETIQPDEFDTAVKAPVRKCLDEAGKTKILYIVLSYLTPFKMQFGNRAVALDQLLADVWDEYLPAQPANPGKPQPYFGDAESQGNVYVPFLSLAAYREREGTNNIYSVWRLDGANAELARGLVDKALAAERGGLSGIGCFDRRYGAIESVADAGLGSGDWDVYQAAEFAKQAGFRVIEDDHPQEFGTSPAPLRCENAALYAGWYSLNHYFDAFSWAPGAIGIHLDSYSALNPRSGPNWVANAIQKGITITSGAVAEPFLAGLPHPDQMLLYLFQGANVGDAMLRSTRWLKWNIINIGDPLYRPFPKGLGPFNASGYEQAVLAVAPQSVMGGTSASVLFHITTAAPKGGTPVTFKSDHPELIVAPEILVVPEKTISVNFPIIARPVTNETVVRISATAGEVTKSNTVVLYPAPTKP